jgi:hypothetical protein
MGDDAEGLVKTGKVVELRDLLCAAVHTSTRYLNALDDAAWITGGYDPAQR